MSMRNLSGLHRELLVTSSANAATSLAVSTMNRNLPRLDSSSLITNPSILLTASLSWWSHDVRAFELVCAEYTVGVTRLR